MIVCNMEEAGENREIKHVSTQQSSFPIDLMQRFIPINHLPRKSQQKTQDEEEDVELSLGLSMNGRFGVDPERSKKLFRSSSISNLVSIDAKSKVCLAPVNAYAPLTRTCSLPTETEEEWMKRKEFQSLRRMEAKRKRLEKLKNVRVVREKVDFDENCEENGRGLVGINGNGELSTPPGMTSSVSGVVGVSGVGIESKGEKDSDLSGGRGLEGLLPAQPSSQGSTGSHGSGSSGVSDFESQPIRGANIYTEERSPASLQSPVEQIEQKPIISSKSANVKLDKPTTAASDKPSLKTIAGKDANEPARNMMADMPCVSTRGDRPNEKKIEGFLYRYRKGEEVKIVCVCHGSFLSPAEFVKHAGGGDVTHPLRHIVVTPSPFS